MSHNNEAILLIRAASSDLDNIADTFPEHVYTNPHQRDLLLDTICLESDDQVEALRETLGINPNDFDWREQCQIVSHILFY